MNLAMIIIAALVILIAYVCRVLRLLSSSGAAAAVAVGLCSLYFGGVPALALLFLFFATSNLLGRWQRKRKEDLGFEKGGVRDHWQVLANGGPAVLGLVIGHYVFSSHYSQPACLALFAAGLAEANADTWATEVGSISKNLPHSILTGRPVHRGESGGVSFQGTTAAVLGAMLIAGALWIVALPRQPYHIAATIAVAGFCGAMVDSVLGATLQAQYEGTDGRNVETKGGHPNIVRGLRWLHNDGVNFAAGLSSVIFAAVVLWHA